MIEFQYKFYGIRVGGEKDKLKWSLSDLVSLGKVVIDTLICKNNGMKFGEDREMCDEHY